MIISSTSIMPFTILDLLNWAQLIIVLRAGLILVIGLMLAKFVTAAFGRALKRRSSPQQSMVIQRVTYYTIVALALASALRELGLDLTVLLGAAGILTVAIGFASRTSASNLISGLFLIGEQSFVVSDVIVVDGQKGEVISIDLLSIKLRTFDNRFVRVPNERLLSNSIVNLSRFPIRRADLNLRVGFEANVDDIKEILLGLAERNPICLAEPAPLFLIRGFGDYGVEIQFSIWATQENYLAARNQIQVEITQAFSAGDISLPPLHRIIVANPEVNEA